MASEDFVVRNGLVVANSTTTHVTANAVGVTANSFSGNAVNLTTLNATELTTGTVPSARLSGTYNITSNNATYLNGQLASYYLSASNINAGTLPSARLSGSYTIVASNSTLAAKASTVASGGADGAAITFTSTTIAGTPTYVWGGTNISTGALYAPANFSVNYATSAGSASTATSASSATLATKASTLSQNGGTGAAMTFNWVGQTGQPSWLWGGNDGVNHYVWNPANFSVNYATSAGNADTLDGYHAGSFALLTGANFTGRVYGASSVTYGIMGTSSATYGIMGQSSVSNLGGILGYSQNGSIYGILGYNNIYCLYGNGDAYISGQVIATSNITAYYSDKRLKTNITPISKPLELLSQINGVYFTENDLAKSFGYDNDEVQIGVLAQEVQKVVPNAVTLAPFDIEMIDGKVTSKSGKNYLTVKYEKLVPLLIEAVKELKNEVDQLKSKLGE